MVRQSPFPRYCSRLTSIRGGVDANQSDNEIEKAAKARKLDEVETTPLIERGGWLNKQGAMGLKQWRQRWFVLKPQTLAYFKTPKVRAQHSTQATVS